MQWTSALAIYLLFWVMSAFIVLPIGIRTADEAGTEKVAGQAESAPHVFRPWVIIGRTTALSAAAFGLFYLNYVNGWVGPEIFAFLEPPAGLR
jgi:predicted secreted protein